MNMDMETMKTETTGIHIPRRPVIAVLLSFFAAGVGHIYCGRFGKGIVLFFAGSVLGFPGMLGILPLGLGYRIAGIIALLAGIGIWLYALLDARRIAKKSKDYVQKDYNRWWVYLLLILLPLPISTSVAFQVRQSILEAFIVPSQSMFPTIQYGDRVLANKIVYRSEPVRRGDIIVFPNPNKRHQMNIKRIVALPGDTIEIRSKCLYINGQKLPRKQITYKGASEGVFEETNGSARYQIFSTQSLPSTNPSGDKGIKGSNFPKTTVPNGHCFVLGDNRDHSEDSRNYGPVPLSDIVGRVDYIYYPKIERLRTKP